ncbi:MAG: hypothetical protein GYA24_12605, partial [Candidatus Lokiarchaeota archaeon]|nr:hypothetical protein [Candidatus Lokiarchaeota archaeon]
IAITPAIVAPGRILALQDGLLATTAGAPASNLPASTTATYERYETPRGSFIKSSQGALFSADGTLVARIIVDDVPDILPAPAIGTSTLGHVGTASKNAYRWSMRRILFPASGAAPVNITTGMPLAPSTGEGVDVNAMGFPLVNATTWPDEALLVDGNVSTGISAPFSSPGSTRVCIEGATAYSFWSAGSTTAYTLGAGTQSSTKYLDFVRGPGAIGTDWAGRPFLGREFTSGISAQVPSTRSGTTWADNIFVAYRQLATVGGAWDVSVTFNLSLPSRLSIDDVPDNAPIKLRINSFAVHEIKYDQPDIWLADPIQFYMLPVTVKAGGVAGQTIAIAKPNPSEMGGDIQNSMNNRRLAWQQHYGDNIPANVSASSLFDKYQLDLAITKAQLQAIMTGGLTLVAAPEFSSKAAALAEGGANSYWIKRPAWGDDGEFLDVNNDSWDAYDYASLFTQLYVERLGITIGEPIDNRFQVESSSLAFNVSTNGLLQTTSPAQVLSHLDGITLRAHASIPTDVRVGSIVPVQGTTYTSAAHEQAYAHAARGIYARVDDARVTPEIYDATIGSWTRPSWMGGTLLHVPGTDGYWIVATVSLQDMTDPDGFVERHAPGGIMQVRFLIDFRLNAWVSTSVTSNENAWRFASVTTSPARLREVQVLPRARDDATWLGNRAQSVGAEMSIAPATLVASGIQEANVTNARQVFIEQDVHPCIEWVSASSPATSTLSSFGYANYTNPRTGQVIAPFFDGITFTMAIQVRNHVTGTWQPFPVIGLDYGKDITAQPVELPFFLFSKQGMNTTAALARSTRVGVYLTGTSIPEFINLTSGIVMRVIVTFHFADPATFDAWNLHPDGWPVASALKEMRVDMGPMNCSIKCYDAPRPVTTSANASTASSTLPLRVPVTGMGGCVVTARVRAIANVSLGTAVASSFDHLAFEVVASIKNDTHTILALPPIQVVKSSFSGTSALVPLEFPATVMPAALHGALPALFSGLRIEAVASCTEGITWDGWTPLQGSWQILLQDINASVECNSTRVESRFEAWQVVDMDVSSMEPYWSSAQFLSLGTNVTADVTWWTCDPATGAPGTPRSLLAEKGLASFVLDNGGGTQSLVQLYHWPTGTWINTVPSVSASPWWTHLGIGPAMARSDLEFLYYPGGSGSTHSIASFASEGVLRARVLVNATSMLHDMAAAGSVVQVTARGMRPVVHDYRATASVSSHVIKTPVDIAIDVPEGHEIDDIDAIDLGINGTASAAITDAAGRVVTAAPGIAISASPVSVLAGGSVLQGTTIGWQHGLREAIERDGTTGTWHFRAALIATVEVTNMLAGPVLVNATLQVSSMTAVARWSKWEARRVASTASERLQIADIDGVSGDDTALNDVLLDGGMLAQNNMTSSSYRVKLVLHEFGNESKVLGTPVVTDVVIDHGAPRPRFLVDNDRIGLAGIMELGKGDVYLQVLQPAVLYVTMTMESWNGGTGTWDPMPAVPVNRRGDLFYAPLD